MLVKKFKVTFASLLISIFITACGGGDSSSDDSQSDATASTDTTTNNGVTTTFSRTSAQVGDEISITFAIDSAGIAGTIHWRDNSTDRISGNGVASHTYSEAGSYSINIVLDDGTLIRLGTVIINPAENSMSSSTAVNPTVTAILSIPMCNADFIGSGGSGVGNIQFNSLSGRISSTDPSANLTGTAVQIIARITSITGAVDFFTLGSVTTDINGDFSRTTLVQGVVDFPNSDFALVQTFFGFTSFSSFSFNSSASECDSTDTSL